MIGIERLSTLAGELLCHVIERALERAAAINGPVGFSFNGADVIVTPGDTAENVEEDIYHQWELERVAYGASAAGQCAARESLQRVEHCQSVHDDLMFSMDHAFMEQDSTIEWLYRFSSAADHTGVTGRDFARVAAALEAAGYKESDELGRPVTDYQNKDVLARYLVGQCIDHLRRKMPPHPGMMERFTKDYRKAIA